jgi:hypothetical protein
MTTDRGFVQSIDVGRGGLVTVNVLLVDGTVAIYVISDLDADPERFNERLSKLAILRDAMNRAEPVEIDHEEGPAGQEIERAERITRDTLSDPAAAQTLVGLVVGVLVHGQNQATATAEVPDYAEVALLLTTGGTTTYRIDLQIPERATATDQLGLVRDAYAAGNLVGLTVGAADAQGNQWVLEVATGGTIAGSGGEGSATAVSGFVESLALEPLSLPAPFNAASLASVGFTTAPEFTGPGGTVDTAPFTPTLVELLVVEGSLTYMLFKAGLQENLRMQVLTTPLQPKDANNPPVTYQAPDATASPSTQQDTVVTQAPITYLVTGAELLAPLASASRPVWIQIDRDMLDKGPDAACVPGVPSSDLTPKTLRDLGIPYTALWRGLGCFNRGVYRFQIQPPAPVKIWLGERPLCLYPADEPGVKFAYACVEGDHEVRVEIEGWKCGSNFALDVYRIR